MAEPTNTPMPTAPPTPRSNSPAPPIPGASPSSITTLPLHPMSSLLSPALAHLPVIPSRLQAASPAPTTTITTTTTTKPRVLHLGSQVEHRRELYSEFATHHFDVVRPSWAEHERGAFAAALREGRWGRFDAVLRCSWGVGGEMGPWDAELVDLLPDSVRVFASVGAGCDGADTKLLGERGIIYCGAGPAAAEAVAELALAMIISTFRTLTYPVLPSADKSAPPTIASLLQPHSLRGQVLGLVGFGNVGQQIAHKCRAALGMHIAYHDVVERKTGDDDDDGAAHYCDTLEALYRKADCVVLCTPPPPSLSLSGAGRRRIVDEHTLWWFKPGARLVSVAHGSLVDEDAVAEALGEDRLSAVALDEPRVSPRLQEVAGKNDCLLLTGRRAGDTAEAQAEFEELGMRNIMAVLGGGGEALTPVNMQWVRKVR
ncbi:hypothetical protein F5X96DRAFT_124862 [Biscogniauxia mediterranea]|nr:hypothetical protein F5X96DRAFT_124862 [Biscogniauxia mediterranea]